MAERYGGGEAMLGELPEALSLSIATRSRVADETEDAATGPSDRRWPTPYEELRALLDGAVHLAEATTEDAVALRALDTAVTALGSRGGAVRLLQGGHLHLIHHRARPVPTEEEERLMHARFAPLPLAGDSPAALAVRTGQVRALQSPDEVARLPAGAVASTDGSYVYVPIAVGGRTLGVMGMGFDGYRSFDPMTIQALAGFGQHAALALERVRLNHAQSESLHTLAMAAARAEGLQRATRAFARALTEREVLDAAVEEAFKALLPEAVSALLLRDGALHHVAGRCEHQPTRPYPAVSAIALEDGGPYAAALRSSAAVWFDGAESPAPTAPNAAAQFGLSGGAVALVVDGTPIGVLGVAYANARVVPHADREMLQALGELCSEALRRVRIQQGKERADAHAQVLHRVTAALSLATTMDDVIRAAVGELHEALGATSTLAGVVRDGELHLVDARGRLARFREHWAKVGLDRDWPPTVALREVRTLWYDDGHPLDYEPVEEGAGPETVRSGALLPFVIDGEALGVLGIDFHGVVQLGQADRHVIESVVSLCSEALRRARSFEQQWAAAARYEQLFASYERLFARHPQPMAVFDEHGREILAANDVLIGTVGYPLDELLALHPFDLLHPSERPVVRQRMVRLGDRLLDAHFYPLVRVQRRDGSTFIADITSSAVNFAGRSARLVLLEDQTAWVAAEHERRHLQERVVTVAEEERRRISIDLHDGAVQDLSVVVMKLAALRRRVQRGELPSVEALLALEGAGQTTVNMLRGLMQQLYPTSFAERGLGELIAEIVPSGPWAPSLEVVVQDRLEGPVPLLAKAALYRVVVEALTNTHKHAAAHRATVELSSTADEVVVCIVDDGIGIGQANPARPGHFGLTSMRDRVSLLGGHCSIENAPSGGTRVRACVPVGAAPLRELPLRIEWLSAPEDRP